MEIFHFLFIFGPLILEGWSLPSLNQSIKTDQEIRGIFKCLIPWGIFPDLVDCEYFYLCLNWKQYRVQCLPTLAYDPTWMLTNRFPCRPKNEVLLCLVPNLLAFKCTGSDGFYPDSMDCSLYYLCLNKTSFGFQCPDGLLFDKDQKICVNSAQAKCKGPIPGLPPLPISQNNHTTTNSFG